MTKPVPLRLGARTYERGSEALVRCVVTTFALWTDKASECAVRITRLRDGVNEEKTIALQPRDDGVWILDIPEDLHGARYVFILDGKEARDPYAAFLPDGVATDAEAVVWRSSHEWKHSNVTRALRDHVIYELHIGTFTPEGTFASAERRLSELVALGVTAIELMPIAAFPGGRGWGYDGVAHYAPFAPYGNPDQLRSFVDAAHGVDLAVLLDVVYNHFGPAGNVLYAFSDNYFTSKYKTAWGDAPNFDHPQMRTYVVQNVLSWLEDFRFDGLRFDAVHAIVDQSPKHICREIVEHVAKLPQKRILLAEDDRNDPKLIHNCGFDGIWADDFHHQLHVALTREADGYYAAYQGSAADIARTIEDGWFYVGQEYRPSGKPRGKPAKELSAEAFLYCIQNHDQIGNRAFGSRLGKIVEARTKAFNAVQAAAVLLLFLPMTPILFMGQEWASASPFLYFTDHEEELGHLVTEGRRREFERFEAFTDPSLHTTIPDPQSKSTFDLSRLDWAERGKPEHSRIFNVYKQMLKLRASDPVLRASGRSHLRARAEGDVLIVERWLDHDTRTLFVNFGDTDWRLPIKQATMLHATDSATFQAGRLRSYDVVLVASQT